jgi:hypothetical protein
MRCTVAILALPLLAAHCEGALGAAKADFQRGRAADAKAKLLALEPEAATWDACRRAEYELYRGLVAGSLGDATDAKRWLLRAKATTDREPRCLGPDDAARLKQGVDSYP